MSFIALQGGSGNGLPPDGVTLIENLSSLMAINLAHNNTWLAGVTFLPNGDNSFGFNINGVTASVSNAVGVETIFEPAVITLYSGTANTQIINFCGGGDAGHPDVSLILTRAGAALTPPILTVSSSLGAYASCYLQAAFMSSDGSPGVSGTFTSGAHTITIKDGIITAIT